MLELIETEKEEKLKRQSSSKKLARSQSVPTINTVNPVADKAEIQPKIKISSDIKSSLEKAEQFWDMDISINGEFIFETSDYYGTPDEESVDKYIRKKWNDIIKNSKGMINVTIEEIEDYKLEISY